VEPGTGAAITASQLFQHPLISDDVKDIAFIVGDIHDKARAANKLIEFSNLRTRNFQKFPVLLQPNCQFLGFQSILQKIAGVIGATPNCRQRSCEA